MKKLILRILSVIFVTLLLLVIGLYGVMWILVKGPSSAAKQQFVCAVQESSAMGWVANLYLSQAEIDEILEKNRMQEVAQGTVSDTDLIHIAEQEENTEDPNAEVNGTPQEEPEIQIEDVMGTTYRGKMMIVKDPSRIFVGTVEEFKEGTGQVVADIAKRYGAVGGINGGEFVDMGSYAYSAMPVGCVISQGNVLAGSMDEVYNITGFNKDNILVVGKMTLRQAIEMGIRDCVHTLHETGPFLIINGEPLSVPDTSVYGGGKNPRTAIGQRADGSVLLLTVDGRQANSIGATFKELVYIMQDYGAVNAAAMDGGTSTQMVYNGEVVNSPYSPTGPRTCPTAYLVAP
ncbi:MAG TPA: phosphodiester glycosidase family protein [Candidatus Fimimorpha faecalis]|uniref:Phosphodiester glycosidase family protein n=1 Tax=Candidatus Fimimorpha faecalis TaxID=2840824 RepID=A0A9D1EH49_9FIRM|nr:phosphodiester glycosidase family protein [Candidatus Fimimorpha faecalis]